MITSEGAWPGRTTAARSARAPPSIRERILETPAGVTRKGVVGMPRIPMALSDNRPMEGWAVWRQDDHGNRNPIAHYDDRVSALARMFIFESGHRHKQTYGLEGSSDQVYVTNRVPPSALAGKRCPQGLAIS